MVALSLTLNPLLRQNHKIRTCDPLHPMHAPAFIGNSFQATRISFLRKEFAFGNASASIKPRFSESK